MLITNIFLFYFMSIFTCYYVALMDVISWCLCYSFSSYMMVIFCILDMVLDMFYLLMNG